ncbi:MAG: hypothetical protein JNM20_15400 [Rhizobiales bacterium]|nr:hypothetical protein [Hyphomicrobiales bacterium]
MEELFAHRAGFVKRFKNVVKALHVGFGVKRIDFGVNQTLQWRSICELFHFRDGLVHAAASIPYTLGQPDEGSKTLKYKAYPKPGVEETHPLMNEAGAAKSVAVSFVMAISAAADIPILRSLKFEAR